MTMLRGLSQVVKEVDSRKVAVGNSEHILRQGSGRTLVQCEIGGLKRDEQGDDVHRHFNVSDIGDPVGGIQDEGVAGFVRFHLHVLDVPAVDVVLGKCADGGLFGSDVTFLRLDKTPEKPVRRGYLYAEHNLRWQVVLVGDLQRSDNIWWLNLKCLVCRRGSVFM